MRKRSDLWENLRGRQHWHLCKNCRRIYDDNCKSPQENEPVCRFCLGHDRPIWVLHRDPRECCSEARRVSSLTTRASYRLAGDLEWSLCPTCCRAQAWFYPGKS